jgi:hypothetical protein
MKYKFLALLIPFSLFFITSSFAGKANDKGSVEFFVSNNTGEIDLQTAFNRLKGNEQQALQDEIINIMQQENVEQGKFVDLLGTYQMSSDKNITADNSEIFVTSSYQTIPTKMVFSLAEKLANSLKQDSVAVFIPSKQLIIGDTILKFKSHDHTINETVKIIHDRLPMLYSQAFSIHLNNTCSNFNNATVQQVEWLGSKIKPNLIQKIFPQDAVSYHYGTTYLVYKNHKKEPL